MKDFNHSLLVPISLEAFVMNENVKSQGEFRRWQMEFHRITEELQNPEAAPFNDGKSKQAIENGIYLHWALPDALKNGVQQPGGEISFPWLPNRWLVVRLTGESTNLQSKYWLIQSDLPGKHGGSYYLDTSKNDLSITSMGYSSAINDWPQTDTETGWKINATGYGHTGFLAYQPFVNNMFAFFDPLPEVDLSQSISYMVIGWYSEPNNDILNSANKPADLAWSYTQPEGGAKTPTTSVYHAMVYDIHYQAAEHINHQRNKIHVAVGNNSVEAFTALLEQWADYKGLPFGRDRVDLMRAFQYDMLELLDSRDGAEMFAFEARKYLYNGIPGGFTWEIADTSRPTNGQAVPLSLTADEESQLSRLNQYQDQFEALKRELADWQQQLYETWWKSKFFDENFDDLPVSDVIAMFIPDYTPGIDSQKLYREKFQAEINRLKDKIRELIHQLNTFFDGKLDWPKLNLEYKSPIETFADVFNANTKVLEGNHRFKANPKPNFWLPNDPVVMITGVNQTSGLNFQTELSCRLPGQILRPEGSIANPPTSLQNAPELIEQLFGEFLILKQTSGTTKGVQPDPIAVKRWQQPWQPLFLEWELVWFPIPFDKWQFDGRDYQFIQPYTIDETRGCKIKGRSILTPHNTYLLKNRLEKFLTAQTSQEMQEQFQVFLKGLNQWDFISQQLTGFNRQLLQRSAEFLLPPDDSIRELIDESYSFLPLFKNVSRHFQEARHGQFIINQLLIYDAFGQVLGVVEDPTRKFPSLYSSEFFRPINEESLRPTTSCDKPNTATEHNRRRFSQLAPRLLHPSRLNLTFTDAVNDQPEAETPGMNPVCGWLIPNRLDQGIFIYGQNGVYLGSLCPQTLENGGVIWIPAPGDIISPDNQHLAQIVDSLKLLSAADFINFTAMIDETLWTIAPENEPDDLAFVSGRPLAVIRAKIQLETAGPVIQDPFWPSPEHSGQSQLEKYKFAVKIGNPFLRNDGVIGYFSMKEPNQLCLNAVQAGNYSNPFIKQIGPGNYLELQLGKKNAQTLTILVDSTAQIHLETGLLPPQAFSLPEKHLKQALRRMEIVLSYGPLLSSTIQPENPKPGEPDQSIRFPIPPQTDGQWSWLQQNKSELKTFGLRNTETFPNHEDQPSTIMEGYLKYLKPEKE